MRRGVVMRTVKQNTIFPLIKTLTVNVVCVASSLLMLAGSAGADSQITKTDRTDLMQVFQQARHSIESEGGGNYQAVNSGNQQRHQFLADGFVTRSANEDDFWQWGLELTGYGDAENIQVVQAAIRQVDGQRIEYQRGSITEWYRNLPVGLEQGFTLTEAPPGNTGHLVIEMTINGGLDARWLEQGQSLAFYDGDGSYVLTYQKLVAFDADKQKLPAFMALANNTLQIHVDSRGASWPIVVDPLVVNEQKVTAQISDSAAGDNFGFAVSLDGDTALIGAYQDDDKGSDSGSVFVFVRSGGSWSLQAKLLADDGATPDHFGWPVILEGDTAIVGANGATDAGSYSGAAYVFVRSGVTWSQQAKLVAPLPQAWDYFGLSLALSGDTAVIGNIKDDDRGRDSGSAHVFTRTAGVWTHQAKLLASDGASYDYFGFSASLVGDTVIVGAPWHDLKAGAVYVFTRTLGVWTQQQKIVASDRMPDDEFGIVLSLSGETTVIGSRYDDDAAPTSGSAYVFVRSSGTWLLQQKLTALDADGDDQFGSYVSIEGDKILVSAVHDSEMGARSGAAYLFTRSNTVWTQQVKLMASDGADEDRFGSGVAISGNTIVVGAGFSDDYGFSSGSAYVFNANDYDQWGQQAKLTAVKPDLLPNDQFGRSVAISGDTALIASLFGDGIQADTGAVYVFNRKGSNWALQQKLFAPDGALNDFFGWMVAVHGDTALIGARDDDDKGDASGAVYVYTRSNSTWSQQQKIVPIDGAQAQHFGYYVALWGDTALIGADGDSTFGNFSGAAYVFTRTNSVWSQQAKLFANDANAGSRFGWSVDLSGDTAIVGSPYIAGATGAAYVFTRSSGIWNQQAKLVASDAVSGATFGFAVALEGDTAAIGAMSDPQFFGTGSGAAYIFTRASQVWTEQQKLRDPFGAANDFFGFSIAISGVRLLIGARDDDEIAESTGSALLFRNIQNIWRFDTKIVASDIAAYDRFGWALDMSDDTALIGSPNDSARGGAYFYTFPCGYGRHIPYDQWQQVSVPCVPNAPATVASTWGDDVPRTYGSNWILYQRDAVADAYAPLSSGDGIEPGLGLWLHSDISVTLETDGTATPILGHPQCPSENGCYRIDLTSTGTGSGPLANMLGHPLPYGVDWADARVVVDETTVYTLTAAEAANIVSKTYHVWNGNTYEAYDDATPGMEGTLPPDYSIFIKVLDGADGTSVELFIPARPSIKTGHVDKKLPWYAHVINFLIPSANAASDTARGLQAQSEHNKIHAQTNKGGSTVTTPAEWYVRLIVEEPDSGRIDRNSVFGQLNDSTAAYDLHDLPELPPFGDTYLSLLFPHQDWQVKADNYASDFHAQIGSGQDSDNWIFEIHSSDPHSSLTLRWEGPANILRRSVLLDYQTGKEIPATDNGFELQMNGKVSRYRWVLGACSSQDLDSEQEVSCSLPTDVIFKTGLE
jgi:hypothetical protein